MANDHRAAALLIASLLVTVAVADARLAKHHNARLTIHRDARGVYFASDAAAVPSLTCSKVHGVKAGETCSSVAQGAGLTQDDFLGFNPNINCDKVFVGQWICLAATSA